MQAIKEEYNEITVSGEGTVEEYGEYCNRLLQVRDSFHPLRNNDEPRYLG